MTKKKYILFVIDVNVTQQSMDFYENVEVEDFFG